MHVASSCPFHKWEFEARSGRVAHIPYSTLLPPVTLDEYAVREIHGRLLVWYHPALEVSAVCGARLPLSTGWDALESPDDRKQ